MDGKKVHELMFALDAVIMEKSPTYGVVINALINLADKYKRDAARVVDAMPYRDVRDARAKQLKYPYKVTSMWD